MNIGVIGAGIAGQSHLFDLLSDPRFTVTAVCAAHAATAAEIAQLYGIPQSYDDPHRMLADEAFDGLVIAVPPAVTPAILHRAVTMRQPIVVDKPAASGPAPLRQILRVPARSALDVSVAYNRRYLHHVHTARALLANHHDDATAITCDWSGPFSHRFRHGATYRRTAGFGDGVLVDTASHIIDTLTFLGFANPTVHTAHLTGADGQADIAATLTLTWGTRAIPITINIHDDGADDEWSITVSASNGQLDLTRDHLMGHWYGEPQHHPANDICRPSEDLLRLADGRPPYGATLHEAADVLDTIHDARQAATPARRPWNRPRAKALGRLNGAC